MNGRPLVTPAAAIAAVVALALAHLIGVAASLGEPAHLANWHDFAGWVGGIIGLAGTLAATFAFSKGDYLRKVWGLLAIGAALILLGTALRSYWIHFGEGAFNESPLLPVRTIIVVIANAVNASAMVMLVLTYRRAGLQPEPSWKANLLWVVTGAAALAISVPSLMLELGRIGLGPPQTWASLTIIASTLGDFATVLLVAPILRVAYMLRGGRLAWVWWVLAISGGIWLVYDSRMWLADAIPGDPADNLQLIMVVRSAALALKGLAGFLQRSALASARTSGIRPAANAAA